jgi:hypothetical protein
MTAHRVVEDVGNALFVAVCIVFLVPRLRRDRILRRVAITITAVCLGAVAVGAIVLTAT